MVKSLYDIYAYNMKCLGDFRWAQSEFLRGRRLVLLRFWTPEYPDAFNVYLCSNDYECGGANDFLLRHDETGLPYPILVQTDLIDVVEREQLGPRVGGVTKDTLWQLDALDLRDVRRGRLPAGVPVRDSRDTRWAWKLREMQDLRRLSESYWRKFDWGD